MTKAERGASICIISHSKINRNRRKIRKTFFLLLFVFLFKCLRFYIMCATNLVFRHSNQFKKSFTILFRTSIWLFVIIFISMRLALGAFLRYLQISCSLFFSSSSLVRQLTRISFDAFTNKVEFNFYFHLSPHKIWFVMSISSVFSAFHDACCASISALLLLLWLLV